MEPLISDFSFCRPNSMVPANVMGNEPFNRNRYIFFDRAKHTESNGCDGINDAIFRCYIIFSSSLFINIVIGGLFESLQKLFTRYSFALKSQMLTAEHYTFIHIN